MSTFLESVEQTFTDVYQFFADLINYAFSIIFNPIITYLKEIDFPCLSCYDGFIGAADYLLQTNWDDLFGFNVLAQFAYFADFLNVTYGVEVVFCASVAKFVLRRIPFIG